MVALLSLLGTLAGSWMGVRQANRLVNYRLDELTKKVEKHNQLIERTAVLERDVETALNKLDELNRRVS